MNIRLKASFLVAVATLSSSIVPAFADANKSADAAPSLQQEEPNLDSTPIQKPLLNGQVSKLDSATGQTPDSTLQNPSMDLDQAIKTFVDSARALDTNDLNKAARRHPFGLVIRTSGMSFFDLRSQKPKMSSEEFRKMEYGVIGLDALVRFDGSGPVVRDVYPTCPAANAGIRNGDLIVKAGDYVFKPGDGQRVLWQVVGGKAGTPIDITVLREGELITFHLTRMNIEDIEDLTLRRTFENLLSQLGPPQN